jgi:hypothetical protein
MLIDNNARNLKVCDDGILIPLLVFWTLSIVQFLFKNWTMDNVQKTNNGMQGMLSIMSDMNVEFIIRLHRNPSPHPCTDRRTI